MADFMQQLKKKVTVGIVGGSDYSKITEQLGICLSFILSSIYYWPTSHKVFS